jgi:hypothetical protein
MRRSVFLPVRPRNHVVLVAFLAVNALHDAYRL